MRKEGSLRKFLLLKTAKRVDACTRVVAQFDRISGNKRGFCFFWESDIASGAKGDSVAAAAHVFFRSSRPDAGDLENNDYITDQFFINDHPICQAQN